MSDVPAVTQLAARPAEVKPEPVAFQPAAVVPIAAAAAGGVFAAWLVPLGRPGVGWLLGGLAVCAATAVAVRIAAPVERRLAAGGWALVGLAALAVGTFRAAEWLFGLCLLAAAAAGLLAVTGGRTVRAMAMTSALVPVAAAHGLAAGYRSAGGVRSRMRSVVRLGPTVAVTAMLLLVFGGLLASADAGFSRLLGGFVPDLRAGAVFQWSAVFVVATGLVLAAVSLLPARAPEETNRRRRGVRLVEWAIPVGALVALFAGFVGVQLTVLFGGAAYVLGPGGPSYAQYARGGFWQLLAVTALTLLLIGTVARLAPRQTRLDVWCLRGLVGALALLTLVIVASALFRMHTYQAAYGFTRLRVLVSVVELWLGLVFVLVVAAGVRLRAGWLPRAVVATGIAAVLGLAILNPDRFIAERNLDRWRAGEQLDVTYLSGLSADAVPVLLCLPEPERSQVLARILPELEPGDWRAANLARARALTADC